jgi:uncharacterized protein (TIGR00369 family)
VTKTIPPSGTGDRDQAAAQAGQAEPQRGPQTGPQADGSTRRCYEYSDPRIAAAAVMQTSGLDFLRGMMAGTWPPPPIAATLGFTLTVADPGRVVFEFTPADSHYNPIGSVHGGVYATMLDSACGCAVHSLLPAGTGYTSLDLTVKFLRAVRSGDGPLRSEGTVTHLGSRTALAQAQLTGPDGKLYAHATSSLLILRP